MKNFPLGDARRAAPPSVNLGPAHISEIITARKLKFYTHLDRNKYILRYETFSARGACQGCGAPSSFCFKR